MTFPWVHQLVCNDEKIIYSTQQMFIFSILVNALNSSMNTNYID